MTVFKLLLKIVVAPVIVLLTLFVWTCVALVYVSGLVLGQPSGAPGALISPLRCSEMCIHRVA